MVVKWMWWRGEGVEDVEDALAVQKGLCKRGLNLLHLLLYVPLALGPHTRKYGLATLGSLH